MVDNPARDQMSWKIIYSLSPFAPENLVSRDRFGRPVPRQPAHCPTRADYRQDTTLFFFFFFFNLTYSRWTSLLHYYHPACGHKGSSHLSPVHALQFFIAMQVQHSDNSSTNGCGLRSHESVLLIDDPVHTSYGVCMVTNIARL